MLRNFHSLYLWTFVSLRLQGCQQGGWKGFGGTTERVSRKSPGTITLLGTIHAFTDQLLKDLIKNAPIVYTLEDVLQSLPVLSTGLARFILGILQDIFGDIQSDEGLITMLDSIMASSTKVTSDRATFYKIFLTIPTATLTIPSFHQYKSEAQV